MAMNLYDTTFCLGLIIPSLRPSVTLPVQVAKFLPFLESWLEKRAEAKQQSVLLFEMRCRLEINGRDSKAWIEQLETALRATRALSLAFTNFYAAVANQVITVQQYECLNDRANMAVEHKVFVYEWLCPGWLYEEHTRDKRPSVLDSASRQTKFQSVSLAFEGVAIAYCLTALLSQLTAAHILLGDYERALATTKTANEYAHQALKCDLNLHIPMRAACDVLEREPMLLSKHFWSNIVVQLTHAQYSQVVYLQSRTEPLTNAWYLFNVGRALGNVALAIPYSAIEDGKLAALFATYYVAQTEALVRLGQMYAPVCKHRMDARGLYMAYILLFETGSTSTPTSFAETPAKVLASLEVLDPDLSFEVQHKASKMRARIEEITVDDDADESNMCIRLSENGRILRVSAVTNN